MKTKPSVDYHEYLIERLRDPAEALAYLKAALEERDLPEGFLLALRNIAEARGFSKLSADTKLNRESLYRMLSKKGNPSLASLHSLLDSLGFRLSVEKKSSRTQKSLRRAQKRQVETRNS
jgi:probable addiction module antidote protein